MTLYHSTGIIAASGGAAAKPGMVLLKPTSVDHSGTSASIGANGQVTFTAVTSLSLNGVFSATYDNYVVSIQSTTNGNLYIQGRMRLSGTDATTNYTWQKIEAGSTTVSGERVSATDIVRMVYMANGKRSGCAVHIYGPSLAQATAFRSVSVSGEADAYISDYAATHSTATAYDGLTLLTNSVSHLTGTVSVYGVRS